MKKVRLSLENNRIGILKVLNFAYCKNNKSYWNCICDCGESKIIKGVSLKNGDTKSCGCYRRQKSKNNFIFKNPCKKLSLGEASFNSIFNRYIKSAKKRNINWNLNKEQALKIFLSNCHYCGKVPSNKYIYYKNEFFIYTGIDRMDNEIGYTKENCVACCRGCNRMKSNLSLFNFLNHIKQIYIHSCNEPHI